jgi:peptidoglycan/LPS O-acetylase OafA/YrhL
LPFWIRFATENGPTVSGAKQTTQPDNVTSQDPARQIRLPQLDLLRFAAAVAVTLYHYVSCYPKGADATAGIVGAVSNVTRYGYLGVDLFFMISGFVILWSSIGRDATSFVISRVSRLFPAFWFSLIFTALLIYFLHDVVPEVDVPALSLRTMLANATMVPAIFDSPLIEGVYWTLEIEMRFYALIFALLLLRQMRHVEAWIYTWLAVSIACLFFKLPWVVNYLALQPYGSFFVAGGLFYLVLAKGSSAPRIAGLVCAAAACVYVSLQQRGQFLTADDTSAIIVPALILVFFGLFALLVSRKSRRAESGVARNLGDLTYSLYLTHATMGLLLYHLLRPYLGLLPTVLAITLVAGAVAWLVTKYVDVPSRKPVTNLLSRLATLVGLRRTTPLPTQSAT